MANRKQIQIDILVDSSRAVDKIEELDSAIDVMSVQFHNAGMSMIRFGNNLVSLTDQIRGGFLSALETPIEFEGIVNEAGRALDFADGELEYFRNQILETAPALGILNTEFAEFATEAGKLGIPKDVINEFAVVVADLETATLAGTDVISKNFATIRAMFGLTVDELRVYGGAINMVDDKIGGSFQTIADFVSRTGATGKLAGFSVNELAALGATFQRLGIQTSRASRATNNFITRMLGMDSMAPKAINALTDAGFVIDDLSASFREDFSGGLFSFLEELSKLDSITQINTLMKVVGGDFADEIATLLTGLDSYREAIAAISDEQSLLDKLQDETNKKMETTQYRLSVFESNLEKIQIILGDALLPVVNDVLDAVSPVLGQVANWVKENQELAKNLFIVVGVLSVIAPLIILVGHSLLGISLIVKAFAFILSPIGIFVGLISGLLIHLNSVYDILGKIKSVFFSMFGDNGLRIPDFSPLFGGNSGTTNSSNVSFNPIYNIQGFASGVSEGFGNLIDMIKDNDNEFIDTIRNSANRISRAAFG